MLKKKQLKMKWIDVYARGKVLREELKFRNLEASEIDVRVGNVAKDNSWISLLLYQDSRVAMDLLDETVGKKNWKREHSRDNKNCTISIWDKEKEEWIGKEDTGVESFSDKEKGLASDSFKRSAVNWGIGRNLYSAPKIFLYGEADKLKNDKYEVSEISYDEKDNINKLIIVDKKGNVVYTYPKINISVQSQISNPSVQTKVDKTISLAQQKRLFAISKGKNDVIKKIIQEYNYEKTEEIKMSDYEEICTKIQAEITM